MADLLANLNDRQLAAVTLPPQHALILAGAGSGKTRVLTTRIAWLLSTGQVGPAGILAVTFTNKAAREMMGRLNAMLPLDARRIWIGTFHGLCNRMLRAHHQDAGLPASFQILDSQDQLAAVKRTLRALNVDDEKYPPRQVQWFINGAKEQGLRASEVEAPTAYDQRMAELYAAYDEQCRREGVVDFAELLLRSFELLQAQPALCNHYRSRFQHLLVDEFQDTNDLQYRWIRLLAGPGAAVFAVGDDDQSIYAFRGANVGNMAAFERDFQTPNLIRLEQNYRSYGHILDCANELIRRNSNRLGKQLWTDSGVGEPVRLREALSDQDEARWIVDEVRSLLSEGRMRAQMALLYRSNAQSRVLEHALFAAGMPYRVYGGLRFFERAEIKHALAYLRLIENPSDDGAFLRVVNFPTRGIGARSLEQLQDAARARASSLYDAARTLGGRLAGFVALIEALRVDRQRLDLPELVEQVNERSQLLAHYAAERDGEERIDNLRELVNAAISYLNDGDTFEGLQGAGNDTQNLPEVGGAPPQPPSLAGFLAHASLESGEHQAGEGTDALQLMTVHSAKGLEFDVVFVTGLEEGLFPHENSAQEPAGLEEERRLMYVAITRARQRLYLSFAQTRMLHGQTRYHLRSRFVEELPEGALKWLTPRHGLRAVREGWGGAWEGTSGGWRGGGSSKSAQTVTGAGAGSGSVAPAGVWRGGFGSDGRTAAVSAPFRIGQGVVHAKFGEGVVVAFEGTGSDARVQVNFGAVGVKWLALSIAKLEALG
jgi:DNA helicase-2/ATP-dependent DNA helicase PcrA